MPSSSLGKLSFKEQGLRYKFFIIRALIFVLPFLIVSYLFRKNNVDLELSQLVLLSFIFILILSGFIILRQIFHRFVMVANLIIRRLRLEMGI